MNVSELIQKLKKYPPDLPAMLPGYEGGYNDLEFLAEHEVVLNVHAEEWMGAHEDAEGAVKGVRVLVVSGKNANAR